MDARERHLAAVKRWNANNRPRINITRRVWLKDNRNRIGVYLRRNLHQALRHRDSGRDWRSDCKLKPIVGCSKRRLVAHIEAQFESGMSWENYGRGGWEIDHIRPCRAFDLTKPRQQAACFNFANLRPRWVSDNRGGRYDGD